MLLLTSAHRVWIVLFLANLCSIRHFVQLVPVPVRVVAVVNFLRDCLDGSGSVDDYKDCDDGHDDDDDNDDAIGDHRHLHPYIPIRVFHSQMLPFAIFSVEDFLAFALFDTFYAFVVAEGQK